MPGCAHLCMKICQNNVLFTPVSSMSVHTKKAKMNIKLDEKKIADLKNWFQHYVAKYYHQKNHRKNSTLELGLTDTPGFSADVYQDLMDEKIVDINHVQNLNDFKLLQLGWVFDINFTPTYRLLKSKGYVELIGDALPKSDKIETFVNAIHLFLDHRCRETGTHQMA